MPPALDIKTMLDFNSKEQNDNGQQKRPLGTGLNEVGLMSGVQDAGGLDLPC